MREGCELTQSLAAKYWMLKRYTINRRHKRAQLLQFIKLNAKVEK